MKVGILTFHSADNFGAMLQCYALQETLKELGHEVTVINYTNKEVAKDYKYIDIRQIKRNKHHWGNILRYLLHCRKDIHRSLQCKKFRKRWIQTGKRCKASSIPQDEDIYIVGSDQLWTLSITAGIDSVYWGDFSRPNLSSLYTYAVSGRPEELQTIPSLTLREKIKNFHGVSVREQKMADLLKQNGIESRVDLDPTLLAERRIWDAITESKSYLDRKYLVYYQVRGATEFANPTKKLAESMGYEFVDLTPTDFIEGPEVFLSFIKHSQGVVTSSFHGTVFSLIFHRPLAVYQLHDGHDGRYLDLLNKLGAEACIQDVTDTPVFANLDYEAIDKRLSALRAESMAYLRSME